MKIRTKRWTGALLFLSLVLSGWAEKVSDLHPSNYVNDFAHVIDANTTAQLNDLAQQIDQKAHAQIALVTVNTLNGREVEDYAVDLFKQWGIGDKQTNRGVLILYAIQDRKYRIEAGYGLEPIFPDGKVGGFGREAIPQMRAADYSGALALVTRRVADVIAQDAGIELQTSLRVPTQSAPVNERKPSPLAIFGFLILLVIILFTPLRNILFWLLLGQVMGGGGRGGYGGGGFGGFGGGGGFGGFGGGSSGGGGASGSW